jgi:hypothetical protein
MRMIEIVRLSRKVFTAADGRQVEVVDKTTSKMKVDAKGRPITGQEKPRFHSFQGSGGLLPMGVSMRR